MASKNDEMRTAKGKNIMAVKQEIGGQRRRLPSCFHINICLGGKFEWSDYRTSYVGGCMLMKPDIDVSGLTASNLRGHVHFAQELNGLRVHDSFCMWFRMHGRNLTNGKREIKVDADIVGFLESRDANDSDLDVTFDPNEEDDREDLDDELIYKPSTAATEKQPTIIEENLNFDGVNEIDYDSDDLRSLHGSDDEVDPYPRFNSETDFSKPIKLTLGLKFDNVYVLRRVIQQHSIENKYDYFFMHNGSCGRFTVYCKYRCKCEWDSKHGRIRCICNDPNKCLFKVHAMKLPMDESYQIKSLKLEHNECDFHHSSAKVTSAYLASYYKAWFARARAKVVLYGDAADEYKLVYRYGFAILKYNTGSSALVCVENALVCPPCFQRMYVFLDTCKVGYEKGCRPLIGVDGCHLKGAYPGMILVAVSKDGNNKIFPIAWAIVEVENTASWCWFLEQLMKDADHPEGEGLTLMSDRQKGLLEAMASVASKADVRYCVRHIWANLKLKFSGTCYKEHFWKAAKATTKDLFDKELLCIKGMSDEAFKFLDDIPAKYWSRHAFSTTSKSNMLVNNLCETFNSVMREARDKPVITCLEWIRRYVMRRNSEKWEGVIKYEKRYMPYVEKVLGWIVQAARDSSPQCSRMDEWEVDTSEDRFVVNMRERTCTCNHWMLTGIPCPHAYSCIIAKRERPLDYVEHWYTKDMCMKAYESHIKPMPGHKH